MPLFPLFSNMVTFAGNAFPGLVSSVFIFLNSIFSNISSILDTVCFSSFCACSVFSFASFALVSIPLSPLNVAIVIPAKINNTIILTTNAISVIPLVFFISLFMLFPPLNFYIFLLKL